MAILYFVNGEGGTDAPDECRDHLNLMVDAINALLTTPPTGFRARGPWTPSTAYLPYDVVTNGGNAYYTTATFTSAGTFVGDGSNWVLFAQGFTGTAAGGDLAGTFPNPTLAATANVESIIRANRLDQIAAPTANVSMNSQKVTGLATGTASTDAVNLGQLPAALPPNGAAGQDLSGTYPNPTVSKLDGIPVDNHTTPPTTGQVLTFNGTAWAPATDADTGYGYGSGEELVAASLPASTISNTTTLTGFTGPITVPANTLQVGDAIRIKARGHYSEDATPAIYTIKLAYAVTTLAQSVGGGSAVTAGSPWWYEYEGVVTAIGASGSISGMANGAFAGVPTTDAIGGLTVCGSVNTAADQLVAVDVQPDHAGASNTITLDLITVEVL